MKALVRSKRACRGACGDARFHARCGAVPFDAGCTLSSSVAHAVAIACVVTRTHVCAVKTPAEKVMSTLLHSVVQEDAMPVVKHTFLGTIDAGTLSAHEATIPPQTVSRNTHRPLREKKSPQLFGSRSLVIRMIPPCDDRWRAGTLLSGLTWGCCAVIPRPSHVTYALPGLQVTLSVVAARVRVTRTNR